MTVVGTTVIFAASDEPGGIGTELFRTVPPYDAALPIDINMTGADQGSNPGALVASAGSVYFQGTDGVNGFEPWKSPRPSPAPPC